MVLRAALILFIFTSSIGFAQEQPRQRHSRRGESAGYSSRDATVLSMMGWGAAIGVGIATLCALIPNNATPSGGSSH